MFDDEDLDDLDDEDLDDEDLDDEDLDDLDDEDLGQLGDCTPAEFVGSYLCDHFGSIEWMSDGERAVYIRALNLLDKLIRAAGSGTMGDLTPLTLARWVFGIWKPIARSKRRRQEVYGELLRILDYARREGCLRFPTGDVFTRGFSDLTTELVAERQRRGARRRPGPPGAGQVAPLQAQPGEGPDPAIPPVPVVLGGPGDPPRVLGIERSPLNRAQWKVVKTLLDAGPDGLREPELRKISGDARGVLKRLKESDPDHWGRVILTPGKRGGRDRGSGRRYRIWYPPEWIVEC